MQEQGRCRRYRDGTPAISHRTARVPTALRKTVTSGVSPQHERSERPRRPSRARLPQGANPPDQRGVVREQARSGEARQQVCPDRLFREHGPEDRRGLGLAPDRGQRHGVPERQLQYFRRQSRRRPCTPPAPRPPSSPSSARRRGWRARRRAGAAPAAAVPSAAPDGRPRADRTCGRRPPTDGRCPVPLTISIAADCRPRTSPPAASAASSAASMRSARSPVRRLEGPAHRGPDAIVGHHVGLHRVARADVLAGRGDRRRAGVRRHAALQSRSSRPAGQRVARRP